MEFIATYWFIWFSIFIVCSGFIGYFEWKARQKKEFIVIGSALIGCLIMFFQFFGAISAILTIIAMVLRLIVWNVVN
jgi:hypothetical protein